MVLAKDIVDCANMQLAKMFSKKEDIYRSSSILPKNVPEFARIITGIRRCGKSTLMAQNIVHNDKNAFYLNFDEPILSDFKTSDFQILDDVIKDFCKKNIECKSLYFDEIQSIDGWEVYVNSKLREGFFVTVTGSNASLLSQELGTRLTGRHLDFEVFPFDFTEFCELNKCEKSSESFDSFLELGGFPEYLLYKNYDILPRLFDDILMRDVVVRYGVKDFRSLKVLAVYLATNSGNLITASKLSSQLGLKTTATILEYFSYFEQCYLFSFVPKFDWSAKAQSVNPKKVFCIDSGMVRAISLSGSKNAGNLFETAVFTQIRRKTKFIWYYAEQGFECDFLYSLSNELSPEKAVQVCYALTPENREREVKGLVETCKKFNIPGIILTKEQKDKISYNGTIVEVIPACEFFW